MLLQKDYMYQELFPQIHRVQVEEETGEIELILYHGIGEPGASVYVHMPGILAQWVGVDGAGNWSIQIGREFPRDQVPNIEVFQAKGGYPNSATAIFGYHGRYFFLRII